jgi:hypothetical protein
MSFLKALFFSIIISSGNLEKIPTWEEPPFFAEPSVGNDL